MSGPHHRLLEQMLLASQIASDSKVLSICGHVGSTGCGSTMQGGVKTNGNHSMYYLWLGIGFSLEKMSCREPILTVTKKEFPFSVLFVHCRSWALVPCTSNCAPLVEPRHALQVWCILGGWTGMAFLVLDLGIGTYVSTVWCRFCWCSSWRKMLLGLKTQQNTFSM